MKAIHGVLFDLDDTLYPEMDFVRSGFRAVARYLSSRLAVPGDEVFRRMMEHLARDGRGRVFDTTLASFRADPELVRVCVHVYRSHRPDIALFEDVPPTVRRLRESRARLGIVTDGMGAVQRAKIDALGLEPLLDAVVLSDVLGPVELEARGGRVSRGARSARDPSRGSGVRGGQPREGFPLAERGGNAYAR